MRRRGWLVRRDLRHRRWLLRLSASHRKELVRHAADPRAAAKINFLCLAFPMVTGLIPRRYICIRLREGRFWVADASELLVLWEVFSGEAYPRPSLPHRASTIIDIGANIGATIAYFRQLYPAARIIGFEPDSETFKVCDRNIVGDPKTVIRNQAVHSLAGTVMLRRQRGESWATSVSADGPGFPVSTTTLDAIIDEVGIVDLLKLDVEGAEWEILRSSQKLRQVKWIVGEFHPAAGVPADRFFASFEGDFELMLDGVDRSEMKGIFSLRRRA